MTHISKVTKAELIERVEALTVALAESEAEARDTQSKLDKLTVPIPRPVPEADALAGCVRSLDALVAAATSDRRSSAWSAFSQDRSQRPDPVRRILVHLADRYGVPLIETATEPCSRPHLDDVEPHLVASALRGAVVTR